MLSDWLRMVHHSGMIAAVGRSALDFLIWLGEIGKLAAAVWDSILHGKIRFRMVMAQIVETGYRSQPVVIVTGAFTGAVLAAQALFQFKPLGMETGGGALVSVAMLRELGPSVTALMMAGPGGRVDGGGDRHDEGDGADRRAALDGRASDRLSGDPAGARDAGLDAAADCRVGGVRHHRVGGRGHRAVRGERGVLDGPDEPHTDVTDVIFAMIKGLVFGMLIVITLLPPGAACDAGRGGCRPRDHPRDGLFVAGDPDREFLPDDAAEPDFPGRGGGVGLPCGFWPDMQLATRGMVG